MIWIFGDQHRAQALSCKNDVNVHTPNIDNMGVDGVNFTNALSGFPLCCPFRGSLLTGRYPHHCVPGHEYPLPDGQKTIAPECTFSVDDVDATKQAVLASGGRILMDRSTIRGVGHLIFFEDPAGNAIGAMQFDPGAE